MLQQTQVSRVVEPFTRFVDQFPTVRALAGAGESEVLAAWSGLGYYRRARHLHAAARAIVEMHGGQVPDSVEELRALPGVGRYTAGAIASIVFRREAPIVDGNVRRVLMRLHGVDLPAEEGERWAWERASALAAKAAARGEIAGFNEGLMELGATICTPRAPKCGGCPVGGLCAARKLGVQDRIPRAKRPGRVAAVFHDVLVLRDRRGRVLIEQRPARGLWAGLWQIVTVESDDRARTPTELRAALRLKDTPKGWWEFARTTSHREVRLRVYEGSGAGVRATKGRRWAAPGDIDVRLLTTPHRMILEQLRTRDG